MCIRESTSCVAPATIRINAEASSSNGPITKVAFLFGGKPLYTAYKAPYTCLWSNVPAGNYIITAKATDSSGLTTTSDSVLISVIANQAPSVSITSPGDNTSTEAPATITINANAADADGSITKVDFYNGSTLLGLSLIHIS